MSANPFVKTELQRREIEPMPAKDYLFVVYPCKSCLQAVGPKNWQHCMRQRRHSLRRNEEHPLPTIGRVPTNKVRSPLGLSATCREAFSVVLMCTFEAALGVVSAASAVFSCGPTNRCSPRTVEYIL